MNEQYLYDFAVMQTAQGHLNTLIQDLTVLQSKMQAAKDQVTQQWRGQASELFSESCTKISTQLQQLIQDYGADHKNLKQAIQHYQELEGVQVAKVEELDSSNIF